VAALMAKPSAIWPIAEVAIEQELDVVAARQCARRIAEDLGFERQDQTRIAAAVSELARNAFVHAGGGAASFMLADRTPQAFVVRVADQGRGIADVEGLFDRAGMGSNGFGHGLIGARKLVDRFRIESAPGKGTVVEVEQDAPARAARLDRPKIAKIAQALKQRVETRPLQALRDQNFELMESLENLRRREEESEQLNQELGDTNRGVVALYAELEERAEQLRKASELKTRFLSNMSHEFRTPLNSIVALTWLLTDRIDGDLAIEQERQIKYIRHSAEQLLELVNDLLDVAKVESGKVEVKSVPFTVADLFSALRGVLKPLLTSPGVDLTFETRADVPDLFTDESKVGQILRNLISNALKFTEEGEVGVTARAALDGERIEFLVRDTGIGIAPADQERIFEEFAQVETKLHASVKGTGLGLPLSRSLAQLLGGELTVESVVGQGSLFVLSIPARVRRDENAQVESGIATKILLIDDDETYRYVMRQIIGADSAVRLIEASDGADGLACAREAAPDLIILDLQMPRVDGFTVLNELAADPRTRNIPVVVSTSLTIDDALRARLPADVEVLSKNAISRESVSRLLNTHLQRS
jgi:signal transduction histidine kinase/ActR/RegA family two-component response regulator